jgi:hypothetical protein
LDQEMENRIQQQRPQGDLSERNYLWTLSNNISLLNPQSADEAAANRFSQIIDTFAAEMNITTVDQAKLGQEVAAINYFPGVTDVFIKGLVSAEAA